MLHEDSMNQQRLIQFMDRLVWTSKQKIFLILDNIKVHHGKRLRPGWTGSRSILAAYLRPNAISDIKQLLLCDLYNIALIRFPLSFNITRFPMF